jgi:hypothetical protein
MATTTIPTEPEPSALNGNVKHGHTLLKRAARELGKKVLDQRTRQAKQLASIQRGLITALGGDSEVSPQERILVELIANKIQRWKPVAVWAQENTEKLLNRRNKTMVPVEKELDRMENSIAQNLEKIGLGRRAKQILSLSDYLNGTKTTTPSPASATPSAAPAQVYSKGESENETSKANTSEATTPESQAGEA